jgi:hypothetical protein
MPAREPRAVRASRRWCRPLLRWTLTVLLVLLLSAYVASNWWMVRYDIGGGYGASVLQGAVMLHRNEIDMAPNIEIVRWDRLSWQWRFMWNLSNARAWYVQVPLWAFVLPLALMVYTLRRNRFGKKCCATCGYDLAGAPTIVCSECGTPVAHMPGESER